MKKLIMVVLALMMMVTGVISAFADDAANEEAVPPTVVSWETVSSMPGIESILAQGLTYTMERYNLDVWIPNNMKPIESQEYTYHFATDDGTLYFIVKEEARPADAATPDELVAHLKGIASDGDVTPMVINGISCYGLKIREGKTGVFVFSAGDMLVNIFFPNQTGDGTLETLKTISIASLRTTPAE